jgi:N-methylhydantoinase A
VFESSLSASQLNVSFTLGPKAYGLLPMRVAIDTGGTFTDIVYLQDSRLVVLKVLSTPIDPGRAVLNGLAKIAPDPAVVVRHGTTVATNAMLERKGAKVAFLTTKGFEDTIAIGRQARPKLYDWFQQLPECLVPKKWRFGISERVSSTGELLREVDAGELAAIVEAIANSGVDAIAVSTLFSFANTDSEVKIAAALESLGLPLSVSHKILPEFREYERASTLVANAYVAPKVGRYIETLERKVINIYPQARLEVMQSSGGIISARLAAAEPVRTMLSGPAGGVIGAHKLAQLAGFDHIIGFDMGGTSTDVCLIDATGPRISNESIITGIPISVPMLDIHTAGAGGGSIARFDAGGLLRVGPESAGSDPGPICFGKGTQPTVTDANLVLGRLDTDRFLGGSVQLDLERTKCLLEQAKGSLQTVEEFAAGIVRVIETSMEKAIRVISVEKGYDPRDFTLVAFGGGGPLHACSLARALQVPRVLVPALPGALSALGIFLADTMREYSRTVMQSISSDLEGAFAELERVGFAEFKAEGLKGEPSRSVDLRYTGQGYELNIPYGPGMEDAFHALHKRRYGFANEKRPLEIVNLRVRLVSAAEPFEPPQQETRDGDGAAALVGSRVVYFGTDPHQTQLYERDLLHAGDAIVGPAIISEYSSATILPPGDRLFVDTFGNLVIEVKA